MPSCSMTSRHGHGVKIGSAPLPSMSFFKCSASCPRASRSSPSRRWSCTSRPSKPIRRVPSSTTRSRSVTTNWTSGGLSTGAGSGPRGWAGKGLEGRRFLRRLSFVVFVVVSHSGAHARMRTLTPAPDLAFAQHSLYT